MTPYLIEMLLHINGIAEPLPFPPSKVKTESITWLIDEGLIRDDENSRSGYYTTDRGMALVEMLCRTPLPEKRWIDPRDGSILERI